jgi:hypothetical protein
MLDYGLLFEQQETKLVTMQEVTDVVIKLHTRLIRMYGNDVYTETVHRPVKTQYNRGHKFNRPDHYNTALMKSAALIEIETIYHSETD